MMRKHEIENGTKFWYVDDKLHRLDGPAVEFASGSKFWYQNDQWHRLDGPAIEYADGTKFWYVKNKNIDIEIIRSIIENHELNPDWREWTDGEKLIFRFAVF